MDVLNRIGEFYLAQPLVRLYVAPALLCVIAYVVFRRRDEFSLNALQNTAATIVVVGFNALVVFWLAEDIDRIAQAAYGALGVPTLPRDFWDGTPVWLLCVLAIVARDFADYWSHRLMHTTWGWPTHAAHHSDTHVNAFTTFRVHYLETLVMSLNYIVLLTWLQMPEALPFAIMFCHLHNLYVHMNLPFRHGPLKLLIASPVFHRWHHADVPEAYGKNLANVIPAWDALFGTYIDPGLCHEKMGAKATGIEDKNPFLIYAYPFQQWSRLIRARLGRAEREDAGGERAAATR